MPQKIFPLLKSLASPRKFISRSGRHGGDFRLVFEKSLNAIAVHEIILDREGNPVDYIFLEVNQAFEKHTGMLARDIIGRRVTEVHPGPEIRSFIRTYGQVALTGRPVTLETYFKPAARHYSISAWRSGPGRFVCVFENTTRQVEAGERFKALNQVLTGFQAINRLVVSRRQESVDGLLSEVCAILEQKCGYPLAWAGIVRKDLDLVVPAGGDSPGSPGFRRKAVPLSSGPSGRKDLISNCVSSLEPSLSTENPHLRLPESWRACLRERRANVCLAIPLVVNGECLGVLAACLERRFSLGIEEVTLLVELGETVAMAWANLISDAERKQLAEQLLKANRHLTGSYLEVLERLTIAAETRDDDTGGHIRRISIYAGILARKLGLEPGEAEIIARASSMHDLGKIGIPDAVLRKKGPLDDRENAIMRDHALIGSRMLEGSVSEYLGMAEIIARTHHENWDGSGYPAGLRGEQIPLAGRIVRLADTYEALRSRRHYKEAIDHEESCRIILADADKGEGAHFDPAVLEAFRLSLDDFAAVVENEP